MNAPENPVAKLIRKISGGGSCPRILVDATHTDVDVPDHVREDWGSRLVLDLNPQWPLHLVFDGTALAADFSIKGELIRCRIPYRAIWAVVDRDTQKGAFFQSHMPRGMTTEALGPAVAPSPPRERPKLRVLKGGKDSS